jgi:hypothetical protein
MRTLLHVAQLAGLNAVPVLGVLADGWSSATALVLYWCETVLLAALIAVRIEWHRHATRKRGHYLPMQVTTRSGHRVTRREQVVPYSVVFGLVSAVGCLAQGAFLFIVLQRAGLLQAVRLEDLRAGLRVTAVLVALGFAIDLFGLRQRPFAWIDAISLRVLRRMLVVQVVVIIGFAAVGWFDAPQAVLAGFALFKLLTDIGSQVPDYNPREAPAWMVRWLGPGFADHWRRERRQEDAQAAAQEEPYDGVPMPQGRATVRVRRY